jgi:hypothetical protein
MYLKELQYPTNTGTEMIQEFIDDSIKCYDNDGSTYLETQGDLEELQAIFLLHPVQSWTVGLPGTRQTSDLQRIAEITKAFNILWTSIGSKEAANMGGEVAKIKEKYPNLFRTILIWGWG